MSHLHMDTIIIFVYGRIFEVDRVIKIGSLRHLLTHVFMAMVFKHLADLFQCACVMLLK